MHNLLRKDTAQQSRKRNPQIETAKHAKYADNCILRLYKKSYATRAESSAKGASPRRAANDNNARLDKVGSEKMLRSSNPRKAQGKERDWEVREVGRRRRRLMERHPFVA